MGTPDREKAIEQRLLRLTAPRTFAEINGLLPETKEAPVERDNRWRHEPTGVVYSFEGEDRSHDVPRARMREQDGTELLIDPLDLFKKDGDWTKVER